MCYRETQKAVADGKGVTMAKAEHLEIYELHCKGEFEDIKTTLGKIEIALNGNGKDGLVVKVDRNTSWRKVLAWVCGIILVPSVGYSIKSLIENLF